MKTPKNYLVTTVCGCNLDMGDWVTVTCEHGRDWIIGLNGLSEVATGKLEATPESERKVRS